MTPETTADERELLVHAIERAATTSSVRSPRRCRSRRPGPARARCTAAPITLRVYVAATDKGYEVMPGGLTRIARRLGSARAVARGRRREQGHVGAVRSAGRAVQLARAASGEPAPAPRRPRPAEPHGRQSVLARPLHRARRRRRAVAPQPRDPARRRDGLDAQPRLARARRVDADRAEALVRAPRPTRDAGGPRGGASASSGTCCSTPKAATDSRPCSATCGATRRPCASACRSTRSGSCAT